MPEQAPLQRRVAMNWNGEPNHTSILAIDVMTTADTEQNPTVTLDDASEVAAGY
jgi:hypothetical protein